MISEKVGKMFPPGKLPACSFDKKNELRKIRLLFFASGLKKKPIWYKFTFNTSYWQYPFVSCLHRFLPRSEYRYEQIFTKRLTVAYAAGLFSAHNWCCLSEGQQSTLWRRYRLKSGLYKFDWFWRHVNSSRVISCQEVRESCILQVYIYILVLLLLKIWFNEWLTLTACQLFRVVLFFRESRSLYIYV